MNGTKSTDSADRISRMKEGLYGKFYESQKWRQKFANDAARMALDLPADDDMNIIQNRSSGLGWKEILAIGALMAAGLGGFAYMNRTAIIAPPTEDTNTQSVLEIDR